MAKKRVLVHSETGSTAYVMAFRDSDSAIMNDADGSFSTSTSADMYWSMTEHAVIKGQYSATRSDTPWADGMHSLPIFKQGGTTPAPSSDIIIGSGQMYISGDAEVVNSSILINSSHGNAGLLTMLTSVRDETSAIHAESTKMSTILANSSHGNAGLLVVLSSIKTETTAIHAETTAMSTVLANSSHGNAGLLTMLTSVRDETSAIHAETTIIRTETSAIKSVVENSSHGGAGLRTAILVNTTILNNSSHGNANLLAILSSIKTETTAIHAETTAISTVLANSSHGNAGLLTMLTSVRDETSAIHAESTKLSTILANSSHGNAGLLTVLTSIRDETSAIHAETTLIRTETSAIKTVVEDGTFGNAAIRARGDTAWITGSGSTVVSLSTAGVAAVHDEVIEGTLTARQIQRIVLAAVAGNSTGGGTTSIKFLGQTTTVNRIVANVSTVGDRTNVSLIGT